MKRFLALTAVALVATVPVQAAIDSDVDHLTGSSTHTLIIPSDTTVANSIGSQKTVSLVFRCKAGKFDGYVFTPTYNGLHFRSDPVVATRWGNGKVTTGTWNTNKGGDAFFHRNPTSFLREAASNSTFVFGWQPYGRTTTSAKWDLSKHRSDFTELKRLCGV